MLCIRFGLQITSLGAFSPVTAARDALALMTAVLPIKLVAADVIDF
jgi:hypothetical protein